MDKKNICTVCYENRSVRRSLNKNSDQTSCLPESTKYSRTDGGIYRYPVPNSPARDLRKKGIKAFHSPDTEIDDYSTQIEESIVLFSTDLIGQ